MPIPTLQAASAVRRQRYVDINDYPPLIRAYTELSQRVKEAGLLNRARWFYIGVAVLIVVGLGGAATGFVLLGSSWFQLFIAAALGVLFTQVAFLAHEAGHKQILATAPGNDRLARVLAGSIGMSFSWWDNKHTRHHGNPNRVAKDPDLAIDTISFIEEDAATARGLRRWITKRQGWLFFPLLALEGLNLHRLSLQHLFSRGKVKSRWGELAMIFGRFALLLVPVFLFLPLGMAFAFMGVQFAVFGVCMGASFAPNHKGMPVVAPDAKLDFFSKQVRTSRNIRGGWLVTTLMGGLNYQIEHHLFPNMPRPHLRKARVIVREFCHKLEVPYTETSLLRSYGIVIRYLNEVGLAARDPFECPMTAQFRRV
ncbi:Fatty acid desaturase [Tessaracoccus bendigoensis DSM 12906]|uniref:Fatty acid desaturase n=1 Tax=Tessaracoccus bendigoensis DSM 12906 TaxID=1123357 RepID=A0A1M6IF15_9ACTN|nr:acyl-CoA desaturase [Tessaracoccus bendigoensis]SHJ33031.1 Fatty acid desaturase [Tessaracoccus bendigoensis DSM 12906]